MFNHFIKATEEYCTLESSVPAPYFRQNFDLKSKPKSAVLYITGLGFYEAHINGIDITKGILAPYISNPSHYVYYDKYDISDYIVNGKNVLAVILGNGFQNSLGGYIWDFEKAPWRSAPILSFIIEIKYETGESEIIESSAKTKTAPSPIIFDDERHGEYYDARKEITNWDGVDFDDNDWKNSLLADTPCGEQKLCEADAIVPREHLIPISVIPFQDGYIYDFGQNNAGLIELTVRNTVQGQKITTKHFEVLKNGEPFFNNIEFAHNEHTKDYQKNIYYCKGAKTEKHLPRFTYDGFRYVLVTGVTAEQATKELLTFITYSSDMKQIGNFSCDNNIINKLQEATVRSDFSNFFYFPTDCPQREKNGWTADASLSAEQMLYNITPEKGYKEWVRNIYKAMTDEGKLPGIIPTVDWGYQWGNGPAWDMAMVNIPFCTYRYRRDKDIIVECAEPLNRYLRYMYSRLNEKNLLEFGLGDWCEPDTPEDRYSTPLVVTDSFMAVDIIRKSCFIFEKLGLKDYLSFAEKFEKILSVAIRQNLIDYNNCTVFGNTQTAQTLGLYYGFFDNDTYKYAFQNLLHLIKEKDNHCYCGVIGARVFYDVLADNGYIDLALDIITNTEFPSYGNWIKRGATTLWESFRREGDTINSLNHHFWGFISGWFYKYLAGIRINPDLCDVNSIEISPNFPENLSEVKASYCPSNCELKVSWNKSGDKIILTTDISSNYYGKIVLPQEYQFENGEAYSEISVGHTRYYITKRI